MGNGQLPGSTDGSASTMQVDDGTLARTDSPDPAPVGLDAPSGSGSNTAPSVPLRVVGYARRQRGNRVGNGECFTLADRALASAGARSAADFGTVTEDADYVWGTAVALSDLQPGDIIQMRNYSFDRNVEVNNPDGSGSTETEQQERPHHTAIVESISGDAVTVLEQNAPVGSAVRRSVLYFRSGTTTAGHTTTTVRVQGSFWFYRAQPR